VRVSWCGILSDYVLAVNGVKQGGVLSPVLFCLYVDGLLVKVSKADIGCFCGSNFVGALAYADDIVLLAPTASALRKMLAISDSYASEFHIVFNANKSNVYFCSLVQGAFCMIRRRLAYSSSVVTRLHLWIRSRI